MTHDWIATPSKGGAAKIGTSRLKAFKARRKWMVRSLNANLQCIPVALMEPDMYRIARNFRGVKFSRMAYNKQFRG